MLLAVAVRDTGIGIRESDLDKLFESFSRLDVTRNRHIEGTGLGMAIVTKLLDLMDSKLRVESVYGKGSVFFFEIRQGIADAAPIGTLERRTSPERETNDSCRQYPGARVLVTDDNEMNLKVAVNLLKLFGIQPDLALSGEETIAKMRSTVYDIVFLDHMMPKMDGIETLENLKEADLIPDRTVMIALTANAVLGAREKYLEAGFDDYLSKPISLEELGGKLTKYLRASEVPETARTAPEQTEVASEIPEFSPDDDGVIEFLPEDKGSTAAAGAFDPACLAEAGFSVESGLKYCAGDADFYLEMLTDYAGSCEKRLSELDAAMQTDDLKQYEILVHALKSVSKTVGADDVSELACALEKAAMNRDAEFIRGHRDALALLFENKAAAIRRIIREKK